jgi:CBS domain-containing protein
MSVGRICSRITYLADPDETAQVAAERMKQRNVGTLIVIDEERTAIGILTDRDLALRVVAPGHDPAQVSVAEVMTANPRWVEEATPIEDAVVIMRGMGVRRLPVVDAHERVVGIVSIDDVLELVTEELSSLGRIVGLSHPGGITPDEKPRSPRIDDPLTSGLERAAADLEC